MTSLAIISTLAFCEVFVSVTTRAEISDTREKKSNTIDLLIGIPNQKESDSIYLTNKWN